MKSALITHPQLGTVKITMRSSARRIIARWKDGIVHLTLPPTCNGEDVIRSLDTLAPRLLKRRNELIYREGQVIDMAGISVAITRQSVKPDRVLASMRGDKAFLEVGSGINLDDIAATRTISGILCRIAEKVSPELLLPRAMQLAREIGVTPASWHIMRGFRTLGKCTSRREIHLSYVIAFLPQDLRDYIVWHELAHLSEMSHSPRFHAICDRYCQGREKQLIAALRAFRWPILK